MRCRSRARGARRAVAERVDPQDAVAARQAAHDVLLRERIARPVVGEADDVAALKMRHGAAPRSARQRDPCAPRARPRRALAPQLEHQQRPQLGRAIARPRGGARAGADVARVEALARERAARRAASRASGVRAGRAATRRWAWRSPASGDRGSRAARARAPRSRRIALPTPPRDLEAIGQRPGVLDQLVIEERHAQLDRVGHGHLVGLDQQVVGQPHAVSR